MKVQLLKIILATRYSMVDSAAFFCIVYIPYHFRRNSHNHFVVWYILRNHRPSSYNAINTLLGDNCSIREDCKIGNYCIISRNVSVNYNTSIGSRTKIMDNTHITGNAVIEEDVFISVLVATT